MFFSTIIWLAAVFVPGVWAQSDTAQCAAGFDWVRTSFNFCFKPRGPLNFRMGFLVYALSQNKNSLDQDPCVIGSMLYTSCRDLGKSTLVMHNHCVVNENSLAEHTSLPLNGIHHHNPPGANDTDDLKCDCNTVVYRYEDLYLFAPDLVLIHFSLYMACASCQGGQIYS